MVILIEVSPDRVRPKIGSILGVVIAVGGVLGPVLGGILTYYATWRWVFWINGPIGVVSMALFYCSWPKAEFLPDLERRKWSELDYPGSVLLIAAATLVVFPFQHAGSAGNVWGKVIFLAPLLVGISCWIALIVWTWYADRRWGDKLAAAFPMRLMRKRVFTATILHTGFVGFEFVMLVYAFPLRLQVVNGKSALLAGVMLLPLLGASAVGSMAAGKLNSKKDWICETLVFAGSLMVLGCGLLSTQSATADVEAKALGLLVFVGLGFGMSAASATTLANIHTAVQDEGMWNLLKHVVRFAHFGTLADMFLFSAPAQGILSQVRVLGGSLGIAASSAILGRYLVDIANPGQLTAIAHNPEDFTLEQLQALREAFSEAFNMDMRICAIVGVFGVFFACAGWTRSRQTLETLRKNSLVEDAQMRRARHQVGEYREPL
ncbi:major facilitator superfamily domain-containing protein [Apiospora saccharicola]